MTLVQSLAAAAVIGYLPGWVCFRLPIARREKRGALAIEERVFWHIVISLTWSLSLTMAMAAASAYRFERLVWASLAASLVALLASRGRVRWSGGAARPTASALVPLILIALCVWRFVPASEYIIGGKDPGVYINEGVSIDRTGTLFRRDEVIARVPPNARDLFFRSHQTDHYYGLRFMGVFLNDPASGEVIAGFPHLYPASIAIGYGLAGTRGATNTVAFWAMLGALAVYFLGTRLIGRLPAFLGAALLVLNVIEVWYGRYPNTEVVMQALLFAALLALARGHQDEDGFFAAVAGGLAAVLIFLRFDAFLAIAGMAAALTARWIVQGGAPRWEFALPVLAGTGLGLAYYSGPMVQYFYVYRANLPSLPVLATGAGVLIAVAMVLGAQRRRVGSMIEVHAPTVLAVCLLALAGYALFVRQRAGLLAEHDAGALRTFRDLYVYWPALVLALGGYALVVRREFWRDPAFFLVFAGFSCFFFYKIRVVPENFWMTRRFLPIILPGAFLMAAAAAVGPPGAGGRRRLWRALAGTALISAIGWQYFGTAAPVAAHVEYKGAIRYVEKLASTFTDRDLVIVEGRNAGDTHVLALPLAYIYGRNVLVLESPRPDRRTFEAFLEAALKRYDRVFFAGGAGTDLLSRRINASPVSFVQVQLPEYATSPWNEFPAGPRQKDLGYSVYQLTLGNPAQRGFALDIGYLDDLNVVRFLAREVTEGRTIRWTGPQSFIAATGLTGVERELVLVMHDGGRPAQAEPAVIEVFFNETPVGRIQVATGFKTYRLALPADAVRKAADSDDPAQLRLVSTTWRPRDFLGGTDDRALGVMIDRVEIH